MLTFGASLALEARRCTGAVAPWHVRRWWAGMWMVWAWMTGVWMVGMRWAGLLLVVVCLLHPTTLRPAAAQSITARESERAHEHDPWTTELEGRIPRWMDEADVPGLNVLVLSGGEVVWSASFGVSDQTSGRSMTRDAVFRVESISKPVTAWGVMKLVEQGRLSLPSPVDTNLTSWAFPPDTPEFTIRQLLAHTAGVALGDYGARYPAGGHVPGVRESLSREFSIDAPPGNRFSYSDTGYNLLEVLVEDITGDRFASWMAREILVPLGMSGASFDWHASYADRIPTGYTLRGEPVSPYVYPGRGSGGLFATIDDVAEFVRAGMDAPFDAGAPVLTEAALEALHRPVVEPGGLFGLVADGYALGHFTEALSDGRRSVWHGGQGYGWMTHAQWVPETGNGIILLANSQRAWPLFGHVLRSWSESIGVEPVGMSKVTVARPLARGLILFLLVAAVVQAGRLVAGLSRGSRRPAPLSRSHPVRRTVLASAGFALIGGVIWAAFQDYLFIFSILPGTVGLLGIAVLAAGLVVVASALLPSVSQDGH